MDRGVAKAIAECYWGDVSINKGQGHVKIRKLEMYGFKSFVERTVLRFDSDVTAVVGPNGCGKSNIVDAIRWAMGEQSARNLRGKSMDDVLFNGSEARGPHSFAEVSITFDNADGIGPVEYRDYAEITVTRRLDRQGNSDYLINRTPVRLMDVTNLFLGTGVGRRAYSIVEQGRIGFIVSSRPEDRRYLIEEAAGVTKFKSRKQAAERKMESTRQNLLRVADIVREIERNLASLKRQAQKAERYKEHKRELRELELMVASHKWLELTALWKVSAQSLTDVNEQLELATTSLVARETEIEAERVSCEQHEREVQDAQNQTYEQDNVVRMLEGQIAQHLDRLSALREAERRAERELSDIATQLLALSQERGELGVSLDEVQSVANQEGDALAAANAELVERKQVAEATERAMAEARTRRGEAESRKVRAQAEFEGLQRRKQEASARLEKVREERNETEQHATELAERLSEVDAQLRGLQSGTELTADRRMTLERRLSELREEIGRSDHDLSSLKERVGQVRSRVRSLEELQQKLDGFGAGVQRLLTQYAGTSESRTEAGIIGLVANRIDCAPEYTEAVAAALGERLKHIIVEGVDSAVKAIEFLRREHQGRATLIPKLPRKDPKRDATDVPHGEGITGSLFELISCPEEDKTLMQHLLGPAVLVDDTATALVWMDRIDSDTLLVTRDGIVFGGDGTVSGGTGDDVGIHMLEIKRELREQQESLTADEAKLNQLLVRHEELRQGIVQGQSELETLRNESHGAQIQMVAADKDLKRIHDDHEKAKRRIEALSAEIEELEAVTRSADEEESNARLESETAENMRKAADEELSALQTVYSEQRAAVDAQTVQVTEMSVRAAQAKERSDNLRTTLERLTRSMDDLQLREARVREEVSQGAQQQGELSARVLVAREEAAEAVSKAQALHDAMALVREKYEEAKRIVGEHEVELKEQRAMVDQVSKKVNELVLRERELALAIEHLIDHVQERHRVDIRHVITDYHACEMPNESVTLRIDELLRVIERMGEINLMAIEEYDQQSQRHEFLTSQQKDLEQALSELENAIRQMNRESRRLFSEAFEAVNERFKKLFPAMFGGGKAELRLTEPNDLLETGVDIVAQPPGKKLGSLELMSGGEKALTAVSLIFALFQYKPSPFCLLDEVDAPLDEANIDRFASAVRQMTDRSQFILVTHSKRTMEAADMLYGVTMEEAGVSKLVAVSIKNARAQAQEPVTKHAAVA